MLKSKNKLSGQIKSLKILITKPFDKTLRTFLFEILSGRVFGAGHYLKICLLTFKTKITQAKALKNELEDGGFKLLKHVRVVTDMEIAFNNIDVAVMSSFLPDSYFYNCSQKQLIFNYKIQKLMGEAIKLYSPEKALFLFYGKDSQLNALLCYHHSGKKIPVENFSCLSLHIENRARNFLASHAAFKKANGIRNIIIWGNSSGIYNVDISHGFIYNYKQEKISLDNVIKDELWIRSQLNEIVNSSMSQGISSTPLSNGLALAEHMNQWWLGCQWTSMAIFSDGTYSIPKNLFFSFPVQINNRKIDIIKNLKLHTLDMSTNAKAAQQLVRKLKYLLELFNTLQNPSIPTLNSETIQVSESTLYNEEEATEISDCIYINNIFELSNI